MIFTVTTDNYNYYKYTYIIIILFGNKVVTHLIYPYAVRTAYTVVYTELFFLKTLSREI